MHPALGSGVIDWETSLVDVPPTVLALLGLSADTDFAGQDFFTSTPGRVFGAQEHTRGDSFMAHEARNVIYRDPASGLCDAIRVEEPTTRRACDDAQRKMADAFAETYYDTTRWRILEQDKNRTLGSPPRVAGSGD